jgi:glutamyl-tRNA reductase
MAECLGGEAVPFEEMRSYLKKADVVISATSAPHYILLKEDIEKAMADREAKLLLIDIANPRDIDEAASEVPGVQLHNIDSLKNISSENMRQRMAEVAKVDAIIAEELQLLKAKYKRKQAEDLLARLYSQAECIKDQEVRRAMNKLSARHTLGEIEQRVLQDMSHSIVNKLLSEPTKALKSAAERGDRELLESLMELFGLEDGK